MDYKLHEMKKRHKKRTPSRVHREPGGQVFMVIGCGGLGNLSMTSESKTYKTNKNNLPKQIRRWECQKVSISRDDTLDKEVPKKKGEGLK
jgi:hypothetical protein